MGNLNPGRLRGRRMLKPLSHFATRHLVVHILQLK